MRRDDGRVMRRDESKNVNVFLLWPRTSWDEWLSRSRSWGLCGPQLARKTFLNHSTPRTSSIHALDWYVQAAPCTPSAVLYAFSAFLVYSFMMCRGGITSPAAFEQTKTVSSHNNGGAVLETLVHLIGIPDPLGRSYDVEPC